MFVCTRESIRNTCIYVRRQTIWRKEDRASLSHQEVCIGVFIMGIFNSHSYVHAMLGFNTKVQLVDLILFRA